MAAGFMLEFNS